MRNLLEETISILREHGKTENDVLWVGKHFKNNRSTDENSNGSMCKSTWYHFKKVADFSYNDKSGDAEIALDLVVVGKDFWLEREENEGREWWAFKSMPVEPDNIKEFSTSDLRRGVY